MWSLFTRRASLFLLGRASEVDFLLYPLLFDTALRFVLFVVSSFRPPFVFSSRDADPFPSRQIGRSPIRQSAVSFLVENGSLIRV